MSPLFSCFCPLQGRTIRGAFHTQGDAPNWSLCPGLMAFCPAGAFSCGQDSFELDK